MPRTRKMRRESPQKIKARLKKENDLLAGELCRRIADHQCERCGTSEYLQWHHVITRAVIALRWDMDNALCLCRGCHYWWHEKAQGGEQWIWFEYKFGTKRLEKLRAIYKHPSKQDFYEWNRVLTDALQYGYGSRSEF